MIKKIQILLLFTLLFCLNSTGQHEDNTPNFTKLIQVLPPSPQAASITRYGHIGSSLANGKLSLEIPLFALQSRNLSLPIGLSYSSAGIRVNDMPTKSGMSWTLVAGGCISRTVYGEPDEMTPRAVPIGSFYPNYYNIQLVDFLNSIQTPGGMDRPLKDGQPDVFSYSFNGISGSFILDSSLTHPISLTDHTSKIETNFGANDSSWTFKITLTNGDTYFFGGASAKESSRSQVIGTATAKSYINGCPTAFYLTKIISPTKDSIILQYASDSISSYLSGTEETLITPNPYQIPPDAGLPDPPTRPSVQLTNPKGANKILFNGKSLIQITDATGAKVTFAYTARKGQGEGTLLSSVDCYQPGKSSAFKRFLLSYQYGYSTGSSNTYNNDSSFRWRPFLAKLVESSIDGQQKKTHQFFYNDINALPPMLSYAQDHYGFYNGKNNSTLIPPPPYNYWLASFPTATANRDVDEVFCLKGLLTKVIYPTGGSDSMIYESNRIFTKVKTSSKPDTLIDITASSLSPGYGPEEIYSLRLHQDQEIRFNAGCSFNGPAGTDVPDDIHQRASVVVIKNGITILNKDVTRAAPYMGDFISFANGDSLTIKLRVSGKYMAASTSFTYNPGIIISIDSNVVVGGNRIAKIITSDPFSSKSDIHRFYYSYFQTLQQSSANEFSIRKPVYNKLYSLYAPRYNPGGSPPVVGDCTMLGYEFLSMYSNSQTNLGTSADITYDAVTESFGDNFENGGIEHKFDVYTDEPGNLLLGENILSAPYCSNAYRNGREVRKTIYGKINNVVIPVKQVFTHYKEDTRINADFYAFLVSKKYTPICNLGYFDDVFNHAYDYMVITHYQRWYYIDTVRTVEIDPLGHGSLSDTVITTYNNPAHSLVSSVIQTIGKKDRIQTDFYYPQDVHATGAAEVARTQLISKHVLSSVLKTIKWRNAQQIEMDSIEYGVTPEGFSLPKAGYIKIEDHSIEQRVLFNKYDVNGNILEQQNAGNIKEVYLWGYKGKYPVAKIINSDYLTVNNLVTASQAEAASAAGDASLNTLLTTLRNAATLKDATVNGFIYAPLFGISSIINENGLKTTYEYDSLGRLLLIKDHSGKILKKIGYQYNQ
ncbi:MAG TPA: hypothetical protein VL053_01495 [Arachidicoccus sp.]|nr:hypothetical protein [Arachidicoccus sp.]